MRPTTLQHSMAATGQSPWVPSNRLQQNPNVSVFVTLEQGASGTFSVEHTFDDLVPSLPCLVSQSTTTITVTFAAEHGLRVGDGVILTGVAANVDGQWTVAAITDTKILTITSGVSQTVASTPAMAAALRVYTVPSGTLTTKSASAYGTYNFPVSAFRLNCTVAGAGKARFGVLIGMGY